MEPLDRLREICMALPNVEERPSHGERAWFVRGKRQFANTSDRHHDDRVAFWCAAPPGVQEALVPAEPEKFFRPPYVGPSGWIGMYLDVPVDWDEVQGIVEEGYRFIAEKLQNRSRKR